MLYAKILLRTYICRTDFNRHIVNNVNIYSNLQKYCGLHTVNHLSWCHYFMFVIQSAHFLNEMFVRILTFVELEILQNPKGNSTVKAYSQLQASTKYTPQIKKSEHKYHRRNVN